MTEQNPMARRSAPRYELEQVLPGRTHCSFQVHLIDLSTSGALIEFHQYLKPGTDLTLLLPLGGFRQKVQGSVVHCSVKESLRVPGKVPRTAYRIGVQFQNLEPGARQTIHELIRERLKNDRREQPRLYIGRPAQLEETIELRAINLGTGGGLFAARRAMEFGAKHDFVFQLPTGEVRARGVVRHCQAWTHEPETRFQVGVEFIEFSPNARERVLEYLKDIDQKSSADTNPEG